MSPPVDTKLTLGEADIAFSMPAKSVATSVQVLKPPLQRTTNVSAPLPPAGSAAAGKEISSTPQGIGQTKSYPNVSATSLPATPSCPMSSYFWRSETVENTVSYTHLRAHETRHDLVCRLL